MIKIYGLEARASHPEFGTVCKRAEIPAGDAREARGFFRGWCIVQGYGVESATFEVITSGMTFRENMTRELTNMGARLSLRHGVTVVGPFERDPAYSGDKPRSIMRLFLPNGYAVSLSASLSEGFYLDTEMVTGHEDADGEWRTEFVPGVMEYESRIGFGPESDAEVSEIIEKLAALPSK